MAADAVLVDLDGTVWDSWPWYARCIGGDRPSGVARAEAALRSGRSVATLLRRAGAERRFGDGAALKATSWFCTPRPPRR